MGVAVAVDDGLLVPVVRDVDQLSISGLNRAIAEVAARARAGKLRLDDYGGSTFTIDNTGWFGSNLTMPIINVPEVAILTMEAITKRAGRPRDARRRRHRDPPDHEHGPRHRPPRQRRRPGGRVPARRSRPGSRRSGRTRLSTEPRPAARDREPRRVVVTGGAGFIGCAVAAVLRARGDDVVAVVRDPARAAADLRRLGVALVAGDLGSGPTRIARRHDRRGRASSTSPAPTASASRRPSGRRCTRPTSARPQRVLDAAIAAGVPRIVYVSTVNVFGNTHGRIVDETYRRDLAEGFLSYYDETKYLAHRRGRGADRGRGARSSSSMPGTVYGAGDHSGIGAQLEAAYDGTRAYIAFGDTGISADLRRRRRGRHRRGARPRPARRGVRPGRREHAPRATRCGSPPGRPGASRRASSIPTAVLRIGSPAGAERRRRASACPPNLREIVQRRRRRDLLGVAAPRPPPSSAIAPRDLEQSALRDAFGRRLTVALATHVVHSAHGPRAPDVRARPAARRRRTTPRCRRSRSAAVWPACRPPTARPRSAATPTGSGPGCRPATTTTSSRACSAASSLNTVCEEARCPNIGECWDQRTATIMILGDTCTRACGFCAVKTGRPTWFDDDEPRRVAEAIGAARPRARRRHQRRPRRPARRRRARSSPRRSGACARPRPGMGIEVLIPDFDGADDRLRTVMDARPDILNHNLETVQRLQKPVRKRARWDRSLYVLRPGQGDGRARSATRSTPSSSLMVGLGETRDELTEAFEALREVDCRHPDHRPVPAARRSSTCPLERYYHPDEFAEMKAEALALGFKHVESAPLVRSSYHARDQVPGAELKRLRRQATIDAEGRVVPLAG